MLKKIIASALVGAMMIPSCAAFAKETNYYGEVEFPDISYEDMDKSPFDMTEFNSIIEEIRKLVSKNGSGLSALLDKLDEAAIKADTASDIAYVESSKNNTEENNAKSTQESNKIIEIQKTVKDLITEIYNGGKYTDELIKWAGEEDVLKEYVESEITDKEYELSQKETSLIEEYNNNSFGTYVYTAEDGTEYTYEDLVNKMSDFQSLMAMTKDECTAELNRRGTTLEEFLEYAVTMNDMIIDYYNKSDEKPAQIYKELVSLRDEIAKETGYDNYAQYAYENIFSRDYTLEDSAKFREYVKKYIVPVLASMSDVQDASSMEIKDGSFDNMVSSVGNYVDDISSEMKKTYDYMTEHNLYDIGYSSAKSAPGNAYTMSFLRYHVPFLFASPVSDRETAHAYTTLVHEFGHFNTMFYDEIKNGNEYTSEINYDISEVNSQGLEILFMQYYPQIFGINYTDMDIYTIKYFLNVIVLSCMYDEWQEKVYENPNMTVEEIDAAFKEIQQEYGQTPNEDYTYQDWVEIPHNFESPMYYISYAVSAMGAMDIWNVSQSDMDKAEDMYMKLSTYGDKNGFIEPMKECGYDDIFAEETVKKIADNAEKYFTCGYSDVNMNDWYLGAVFKTKDYMKKTDSGNFEPDTPISRLDTIDTIGAYYEQCGGVTDGFTTTFTDTDNDKYAAWGETSGIINGYGEGIFGSSDTLTREQAAVMLYKFAQNNGENTASDENVLNEYTDSQSISPWAGEALKWAVSYGILSGTSQTELKIEPLSKLTRSQLAQIMSDYSTVFGD